MLRLIKFPRSESLPQAQSDGSSRLVMLHEYDCYELQLRQQITVAADLFVSSMYFELWSHLHLRFDWTGVGPFYHNLDSHCRDVVGGRH